jgi:hypothetical protein
MTSLLTQDLGGVEEPIRDHDIVGAQRGAQCLFDELHVARHVQQELCLGHQFEIARVAAELPNCFGNGRHETSFRAQMLHAQAGRTQPLDDLVRDRGLSTAVDTFEDHEHQKLTPACNKRPKRSGSYPAR